MHRIAKQIEQPMSEHSIKVSIAGRIYPITVRPDEEARVRTAAQRVDDNIDLLQRSYAVKDKQDLLAMTALQMAAELLHSEQALRNTVPLEDLLHLEELANRHL
jgi:cell division protein ZapA